MATVSRVLNGKGLVREETLQQVLEAAKALRYAPNIAARSLSSRRTQTVGIVLPDVHGEFFSEVIRGVDLAARSQGYHILVSGSHSDVSEMAAVVNAMRGRVDGLLVMAPDVPAAELQASLPCDLPLVLLNSVDPERDAITIDNYGGARQMMRHLIGLGHRRIAFLAGPPQNEDAKERLRGYREAMREIGAAPAGIPGDFTEEAGERAAREILAAAERPTALFAANDSMAVGALVAFSAAGVAIPGEISLAGFDDVPVSRYVHPPLTTIRVDIADLGRRAFALLGETLAQPSSAEPGAPRRDSIATTLVIRGSSSPPSRTEARSRRKGEGS